MSTKRSVGRITATQAKVRTASKSKKDRSTNLCAFTFADGRQCRTPRCSGHLHLCYFHAQKEAESLATQQAGEDISRFLPTKLLTACDLGVALSRTFCAVAQGQIKPKVASTLAYLAQTMLQTIPIAQHEYIESFNTNTWRNAVRFSFRFDDPPNTSAPQPAYPEETRRAPKPPASPAAPPTPVEAGLVHPACPEGRREPRREPGSSSSSTSPTAPQPPAQSAPSPHTPLPPTSAEFARQVMAGLNSSQSGIPTTSGSEIPTLPEPGREPGSSRSSSSSTNQPQPTSAPQPKSAPPPPTPVVAGLQTGSSGSSSSSAPSSTSSSTNRTPPAPARQPTPPQQSQSTQNSHHNSPPAQAPTAATPAPPSFGAPANWDALIPPKPRRRFSRLPCLP